MICGGGTTGSRNIAKTRGPYEVTLVEAALAASLLSEEPQRSIGDRAYDSDLLDAALGKRGIEMIAPHRKNSREPKNWNDRKLGRYGRHRNIERLFARLGNPGGRWCATSGGRRTTPASHGWAASSYY